MLPAGLGLAGPNANSLAVLHGSVIHCRYYVGTAAAMIILRPMPAPLAGAGATVKPQVNIVFPLTVPIGYFEPVGAYLTYRMLAAFFLNLLCIRNYARHCCPPLITTTGLDRVVKRSPGRI